MGVAKLTLGQRNISVASCFWLVSAALELIFDFEVHKVTFKIFIVIVDFKIQENREVGGG